MGKDRATALEEAGQDDRTRSAAGSIRSAARRLVTATLKRGGYAAGPRPPEEDLLGSRGIDERPDL